VLLAIGARTQSGVAAAICLALSTALVLAVEGPFWATMIQLSGGRTGAAGGIMNTGSNLGGLISPALTPVLAASFGWEAALLAAAALSCLAALFWFGIRPSGATLP
jgi:dipeptide/tripeptide permease